MPAWFKVFYACFLPKNLSFDQKFEGDYHVQIRYCQFSHIETGVA